MDRTAKGHYIIYTLPNCSYCTKAKQLLRSKGKKFTEVPYNASRGIRSFPQIYLHVGGYADLERSLKKPLRGGGCGCGGGGGGNFFSAV